MSKLAKIITFVLCLLWIAGSVFAWYLQTTQSAPTKKVAQQPLSARNWISAGDYYHLAGNKSNRDQALLAAEHVGQRRAVFMQAIMARYLQWGDINSAKRSARQLIALDASQTSAVFTLLREYMNTKDFIDEVLPVSFLHPRHTRLTFFEKLMESAAQNKESSLFYEIWLGMTDAEKDQLSQSRYWFNYYSSLARLNDFATIDTLATLSPQRQAFNGHKLTLAFSDNSVNTPFCWIKQFHPDANVQVTEAELLITLPAVVDKKRHQLNCYIPVFTFVPTTLSIRSHWSLSNAADNTSTQLRIRPITTKAHKRRTIAFSEQKQGNWSTEGIHYEFIADHTTRGVEFNISLPKTNDITSRQISEFKINSFTIETIR